MGGETFKAITDGCIASGRCFAHEAKRLSKAGAIDAKDPRVIHADRGSSLSVPRTTEEYRKIWSDVLEAGTPPELKPTLLVAKKALGKDAETPVSPRDLAVCLESAAVRLAQIGTGKDDAMKPGDLVERAAIVCDSAVLNERHRDQNASVAAVAQTSGVPPQRVLSGMMRMGLVDEKDHRVQAFIEGHLGEFNKLDRAAFFKVSADEVKSAIRDFAGLGAPEEHRKDVAQSLLRLNAANESQTNAVVKEADVLNATAGLAESFSKAFADGDPERAKRLAGLSMSASSRSHVVQEQYPEKFMVGGLNVPARQESQQE